jgi:hypothetical protein
VPFEVVEQRIEVCGHYQGFDYGGLTRDGTTYARGSEPELEPFEPVLRRLLHADGGFLTLFHVRAIRRPLSCYRFPGLR